MAMARPVTKAAWSLELPEDATRLLAEAFALARAGRPGPVLLDIPMDVQRSHTCAAMPEKAAVPQGSACPSGCEAAWEEVREALQRAERPLILAGGGIRAAGARRLFRPFAEQLGVPVVTSLLGLDLLPYDHPLRVGMIGTYGNRWANLALAQADLLLVLGSRLDVRQTGADVAAFRGQRNIYHVDCDPSEINNRVTGCRAVVEDLAAFFETALAHLPPRPLDAAPWFSQIEAWRRAWPDTAELGELPCIHPNAFMHALARATRWAAAYAVDVGQHQMWAAQSLELGAEQVFLTSGGMGAMGFALPAAIGASVALGDAPVVVIAGDGGFQLNLQELQTVAHLELPIKIVVLNNRCQGMVRQFQQSYFQERYPGTWWGYSAPDFARVAGAYGLPARTIERPDEIDEGLKWLSGQPQQAAMLQVMIPPLLNVYPKVAFGRPLSQMEPWAVPVEIEG